MGKIGIFGGTFNPIHLGHIHLALAYQKRFCFDKILLIPTGMPPHKRPVDLADDESRLAMCRLAVREYPFIEVCDLELRRAGKSYTYDTLTELQKDRPNEELYLIMGSDMFLTFLQWYRAKEMLSMATLLTAPRAEGELPLLEEQKAQIEAQGGRAEIADMPVVEVSSTQIRSQLQAGEAPELLDGAVLQYIEEHHLYRGEEAFPFTEEEALALLQKRLKPERYLHSIGVAKQAEQLAKRYHADSQKAKMTGLLHDICKNDNLDNQLQIMADSAIILTNIERESPPLYHAIAGAAFLEHTLGVTDREVLDAVRYHTTGRAGMCLLEKIIYLADLTSEERCYPDVDKVRALSQESLDRAILYALEFLITDLVERKRYLHPDSVAAYNELRGMIKEV